MVGSIKLFRSLQNSFRTMGISPPNQIFAWNSKKLFFLFGLIMAFISRFLYFVFEAKFVEENGFESFYETFLLLIALSVLFQEVWQLPEMLQLINMYDDFIERSKSTIPFVHIQIMVISLFILNEIQGNKWHLYHGLDVKIERMSKLLHFAFMYGIFVGAVGSLLLMTSLKYFILDLGTESFDDLLLMCVTK